MKTVVIIQARLTSTRLPGKVLKPIGPHLALSHTWLRATQTGLRTVLATPMIQRLTIAMALQEDLQKVSVDSCLTLYGGSEEDVLGRYTEAAMQEQADIVVRLTGDRPFIDPRMVWTCAHGVAQHNCYVANCLPGKRTEPRGLDVEAFPAWALVDADLYATSNEDREHVTPWITRNLRQQEMVASTNRPDLRWVLDTQEDYEWFCKLATMSDCTPPHPTTPELLTFLKEHPEMERRDGTP